MAAREPPLRECCQRRHGLQRRRHQARVLCVCARARVRACICLCSRYLACTRCVYVWECVSARFFAFLHHDACMPALLSCKHSSMTWMGIGWMAWMDGLDGWCSDLVVGAPGAKVQGEAQVGIVAVVMGTDEVWQPVTWVEDLDGTTGFVIAGVKTMAHGHFGHGELPATAFSSLLPLTLSTIQSRNPSQPKPKSVFNPHSSLLASQPSTFNPQSSILNSTPSPRTTHPSAPSPPPMRIPQRRQRGTQRCPGLGRRMPKRWRVLFQVSCYICVQPR